MAKNRQYDPEYKIQAVKLGKEIGQSKAAKELGIPKNTLYSWMRSCRLGKLDLGPGSQTPTSAMSQNKEIRRLKEENEFLEEASAFFAASRRKSARTKE